MAEVENEKRRWLALKQLNDMEGREMAIELLAHGAQVLGVPTSQDQMRIAAHWLSEQGFVDVKDLSGLRIVKLLPRGREIITRGLDIPGLIEVDHGI